MCGTAVLRSARLQHRTSAAGFPASGRQERPCCRWNAIVLLRILRRRRFKHSGGWFTGSPASRRESAAEKPAGPRYAELSPRPSAPIPALAPCCPPWVRRPAGARSRSDDRVACDVVVVGTPIDLGRIGKIRQPVVRARYELQEIGQPDLAKVVNDFVERASEETDRPRGPQ